MTTTIALYPTPQQIQAVLSGPPGQPVVMVNLLRFKRIADPPDDAVSGEDAYRRDAGNLSRPFSGASSRPGLLHVVGQ